MNIDRTVYENYGSDASLSEGKKVPIDSLTKKCPCDYYRALCGEKDVENENRKELTYGSKAKGSIEFTMQLRIKKGKPNQCSLISAVFHVMADYFVIADAENNNQLQAIADNVEEQMMKNGNHCRIEGKSESWLGTA